MTKSKERITKITKKGAFNFALNAAYSAIKYNEESFFDSTTGSNIVFIIESVTGLTFEVFRKMVLESLDYENKFDYDTVVKDAKTLSIKELAAKHECSYEEMRYYLISRNIKYNKTNPKLTQERNTEKIKDTAIRLNGKYTLTELSNIVGIQYSFVKEICLRYGLPYRKTARNRV